LPADIVSVSSEPSSAKALRSSPSNSSFSLPNDPLPSDYEISLADFA
jgi:hypothetical protein